MARVLAGLYLLLTAALVVGAVATWRLRCEGFGCMGLGVAWMAWALAYAVVLGVGALARLKATPGAMQRGCGWLMALQLALGAALLLAWALKAG